MPPQIHPDAKSYPYSIVRLYYGSQHLLDLAEVIIILIRPVVPVGECKRKDSGADKIHAHKCLICCFVAIEGDGSFSLEVGQSAWAECYSFVKGMPPDFKDP